MQLVKHINIFNLLIDTHFTMGLYTNPAFFTFTFTEGDIYFSGRESFWGLGRRDRWPGDGSPPARSRGRER